ncbi:MAG: TrkH family potassium uptake protein, partial [Actinomycetota bacterium]|nr:TrkH family potassium uptake protein [Actinomycetota bacterium]
LGTRDVYLSVTLAWLAAAIAGAVPYLLTGALPRPVDAFFESMSGFTTTGASVFETRIDAQPQGLVLWRSLTQWLGGVGFVVLVVAAAPTGGLSFQRVFSAEATGPTIERRTPHIGDTAKLLWASYLGLTFLGFLALLLVGMGAFDAVNHVFAAVSTGGFSSRPQSVAAFGSLPVELVLIALMVLGATNFALYVGVLARSGPYRPQLAEVATLLAILAGATIVVATSLFWAANSPDFGSALRLAAFQVVSLGTATGFTTADLSGWNHFALVLMLFLVFVGGCAGSTAGGLKVIRVALLAQIAWQELRRQVQPRRVAVLRLGGRVFPETMRGEVLAFLLLYLLVFVVASAGMAGLGVDFQSALGTVAAALNTVGPSVGPTEYADVPEAGRLLLSATMLVGRLEVLTVLVLLVPALWRQRPR